MLQAWQIQFGLSEKLSTAEKVETRRPGNAVKARGAPGQAVGSGADGDSSGQPAGLSGFEKVLKRLDDALA